MSFDQETSISKGKTINHPSGIIIKGDKKAVSCLCPKCGITHIMKLFWTGAGTPRKYCHKCREAISNVNEQCIYEIVPDVFRIHRGTTVQSSDG